MKHPPSNQPSQAMKLKRILRQSAVIVALGCLSGIAANLVHPRERLPWIATKPYDITVPCPEPVGTVTATAPTSPWLRDFATHIIDARSSAEFATWHFPGAVNVPFDWLGPPVEHEVSQLAKRVAASHAQRIVVYGDGDNPDSGREWARLLAGGGIRNVTYVEGGAPALRAALNPAPATAASTEPSP
jgi:rhodanese-related sulfurtransferase